MKNYLKKDRTSPSPTKRPIFDVVKLSNHLIKVNFVIISEVSAAFRATKLFFTAIFVVVARKGNFIIRDTFNPEI